MLQILHLFNFILTMTKYSIVVCSYNRYNLLIDTIESILEALKGRADFELLVIDNNSSDATSIINEKYSSNKFVKYFLETQQGLSHARNRGINESGGEIIVYLDDDIELVENYFKICDQIFADEWVSISGGKVLPYKVTIPKWLPKKYYHLVSVYDLGNSIKFVKHLMGGNFAIRKKEAQKIGYYNGNLGRMGKILAGGEETDYQNRANLMGYKMFYHPEQNILHKINDKLNKKYVIEYSRELGSSERIIDESVSKFKVIKKITKSYFAIILYVLFYKIIRNERRCVYLKIINAYAKGYIK